MAQKKTNKNNDTVKQLMEEAKLLEDSFNFWANQVEETFREIDKIEEKLEKESENLVFAEQLEKLTKKLEMLIAKGTVEDKAIEDFENKINNVLRSKVKNDKEILLEMMGLADKAKS